MIDFGLFTHEWYSTRLKQVGIEYKKGIKQRGQGTTTEVTADGVPPTRLTITGNILPNAADKVTLKSSHSTGKKMKFPVSSRYVVLIFKYSTILFPEFFRDCKTEAA